MANGLLYTNENSGGGGSTAFDYVADVFPDVSLVANDNSGLTDTASTNPLGLKMGNSDSMLLGGKSLFIKEYFLLKDRSKWFNNQATYQVVFTEDFPQVQCFLYGDFSTRTKAGVFNSDSDEVQLVVDSKVDGVVMGMVVTGIIRRCGFILEGSTAASQAGSIFADGVLDGSPNWSDYVANSNSTNVPRLGTFFNTTTQAQGLHTYRIENNNASHMALTGITVYYENGGNNVEFRPGTTYSNKVKSNTTSGASLAMPTYGSSLGGISKYYKTGQGIYSVTSLSCTTLISVGNGVSGTNLVTLPAGHGASFLSGYGIIFGNGAAGTTSYVGSITGISTDTLTVSPTLTFGMSGPLYRSFYSHPTYAINASFYIASHSIDLGLVTGGAGFSGTIVDPQGRWAIYGYNYGITTFQSGQTGMAWQSNGATGAMNIEGNFAAADVEYFSMGATMNMQVIVNGSPGYTETSFMQGAPRRTLVSELGTGWNRVVLSPGASNLSGVAIKRITLFDRQSQIGQTTGLLGEFSTQQAYVKTIPTLSRPCPGTVQRVVADQLVFRGDWPRSQGASTGPLYTCNGGGSVAVCHYVGKDFAIIGTQAGSETITIDGASQGASFNMMITVATEGPHTLSLAGQAGTIVQAFDLIASKKPMKSLQDIVPLPTDLVTEFE